MSYVYYQPTGGEEAWEPIQAKLTKQLAELKPTFVTVLSVDTLLSDKPTREQLDNAKYEGPMYFDLDSSDIGESITDAKALWIKMQDLGLTPTDVQIFLSGKKGFHFLIPQAVFMEKPGAVKKLPLIYREWALEMAEPSVDFKVYSARRGRMLRTCYNPRTHADKPNTWKVPISAAQLETLDSEGYAEWCSQPREATPLAPEFRYKAALVYEKCNAQVPKVTKKLVPVAPHIVAGQWKEVEGLFNGTIPSRIGFNSVAMQMCLYAREVGWSEDTFIQRADGFLSTHVGDGRYATKSVREREIRKMFMYVADNESYAYSLNGLKAAMDSPEPRYQEYGPDDIGEGDSPRAGDDALIREISGGLKTNGSFLTSVAADGSERAITNWSFHSTQPLRDPETNTLLAVRVFYHPHGSVPATVTNEHGEEVAAPRPSTFVDILPTQFTGSTTLQNTIATSGLVFTGSDMNSRGLLHSTTATAKTNVVEAYMIPTEGISLLKVPHSSNPALRKGSYLVWADNKGVTLPAAMEGTNTTLQYVGYPLPQGTLRTDLSQAGDIMELVAKEGPDRFVKMWTDLITCHPPKTVGKVLGWMAAASFRPLFQACYGKFPLLHVYGPAGSGKTELVMSLLRMFYDKEDPKSATPSGTFFAFSSLVSATASIPVVLDEYKPHKMNKEVVERYRGLFRDSYNGKSVSRGGGSRMSEKATALNETKLAAPLAFIAEAVESETAILERSLVVNIRPQPAIAASRGLMKFMSYMEKSDMLPLFGYFMSRWIISTWDEEKMHEEFDKLHSAAIAQYMVTEADMEEYKAGRMTIEAFQTKTRVKPRPVFNATVALFGLRQIARAIVRIVGKEQFDLHLRETFQLMSEAAYTELDTLSEAAVPEYVKTLRTIAEMIISPMNEQLTLREGNEFNLANYNGREVFVFSPSLVYSRYRAYVRMIGQDPLYDNDISFITALRDCPQFVQMGYGTMKTAIKTVVLDYSELVAAGMPPISNARFVTLPDGRIS